VVRPALAAPELPCPVIDPEVCPEADPAGAVAVPALAAPAVCNQATITPFCATRDEVGPGVFAPGLEDDPPLHCSATLVALVTLNCFAPAAEFIPDLALADPPEAAAFEFWPEAEDVALWSGVEALEARIPELDPMVLAACSCPVTCTSFPIKVRTAFKSPVSL
jgi:hypothetical protein